MDDLLGKVRWFAARHGLSVRYATGKYDPEYEGVQLFILTLPGWVAQFYEPVTIRPHCKSSYIVYDGARGDSRMLYFNTSPIEHKTGRESFEAPIFLANRHNDEEIYRSVRGGARKISEALFRVLGRNNSEKWGQVIIALNLV